MVHHTFGSAAAVRNAVGSGRQSVDAENRNPVAAHADGGIPEAPQAGSSAGDDDASIEEYMVGLLDRMRRKARGEDATVVVAAKESVEESAPEAEPVIESGEPEQWFVPSVSREQNPLVGLDLGAMRALARSHAGAAIDKHSRSSLKLATNRQGLIVFASLISGFLLTAYSKHVPVTFVPGIICFAVAIVWGLSCVNAILSLLHDSAESGAFGSQEEGAAV
ncbi:MAG TPA: hypothetical protein VGN12_17055 [Pirellulales bacterium]|jgi:hypothetical protein